MGDMAEDMNTLKAYHKKERQARAVVQIEELTALHIPAYEQSENVFRVDSKSGAVMFYPTSGKWQHKGRIRQGTVIQFRDWLKRHHML